MAIHASRQYQFFLRLRAIIDFSLPHGDNRFHSAYTPIQTSRRYRFSLCLTAIINFFLCLTARIDFIPPYCNSRPITALSIFSLPHGDNQFFFASRQELISFRLTAIHPSRRYQFFFASR
jgi:hypothetical protein